MKSWIQLADARLEALEPWWKRVVFFCAILIAGQNLGDYLWREDNDLSSYFWTGGMFGPLTYVFFGPLQVISMVTTGWVGFRFFHLQKGETLGLIYLAMLVAINTGFYRDYGYESVNAKTIGLQLGALAVLGIGVGLRSKGKL